MLALIHLTVMVVLLGFGAFAVLAGAVVAIIATPVDRSVELPPRFLGIALALIGLLTFVGMSILLTARIA